MALGSGKRVKTTGVDNDPYCKVSEFQKTCDPPSRENVFHKGTRGTIRKDLC